jgi:hypothetical protein
VTDQERIAKLEADVASLTADHMVLKAKWVAFERDMMRLARNPSLIESEVRRQMMMRGMPMIRR